MYNFIDVNQTSEESILPSEALQINGEYIENLISGYRTLNVVGREALSPDVVSYETGVRDGSQLQSKRYPERILVVTYALMAESNAAFREAYNQLGKILDVKNAQLIFNDEQDKFFVGTPCIIGNVDPGRNSVVGEFEILCTDPFKYSVTEYEATVAEGEKSVMVEYNGTYKGYPKLEAAFFNEEEVASDGETAQTLTGAGDCGYVAFFNSDEKIIQLGDPDEVDGTNPYAKSQTLMNQTFLSETAWGTTAKNLWAVNKGHIMVSNVHQMGSVAMKYASYSQTHYSGLTSGTLVALKDGSVSYKVTYSTKNRTADSVTIVFNASKTSADPVFMRFIIRIPSPKVDLGITVGSKDSTASRRAKTYSSSKEITITGLSASQTEISGITFSAINSGTEDYSIENAKCNSVKISKYTTTTYATYYLAPNAYSTYSGGWHGPSITRTLSADASGEVGAANFTLSYKQKMCIAQNGSAQVGSFRMNIVDASGNNIAGIWVYKNKHGKTGNLVFYVNGVQVNTTAIDIHTGNVYFGLSESAVATTTVSKSGSTISFAVGSYKRTFTNSALTNVKATAVTFSFEKYSELTPLEYNGLYWAKFVKHNCNTYQDIPNKFSANDVVVADCKTAEIYLNGIQTPSLGALGNDWEAFYLQPGLNQIGISYSSWVMDEYAPTLKVRYREVFL